MKKIIAELKKRGELNLAQNLMAAVNVSTKVNVKDFFSTYSKIAGKIKSIKKLKGDDKKLAEEYLATAIKAMKKLESILN